MIRYSYVGEYSLIFDEIDDAYVNVFVQVLYEAIDYANKLTRDNIKENKNGPKEKLRTVFSICDRDKK